MTARLPPPWLTPERGLLRVWGRSEQARAALEPILRRQLLPRARLLDIVCARDHRLAQVVGTGTGTAPIYLARGLRWLDHDGKPVLPPPDEPGLSDPCAGLRGRGWVIDEGGRTTLYTQRWKVIDVIDLLVLPTMYGDRAPDALPAQCSCAPRYLSASALLARIRPGRRSRLLADEVALD